MASVLAAPASAGAQWSTTYEQSYLPGKWNWKFRRNYPAAERLFNAFDYGHAILYEQLWTNAPGARAELEGEEYRYLTTELLVHPPRVALEESAIEVEYAKLAPEAKAMFDWAHLLHRQIYDVWCDESLTDAERDALVRRLLAYYRARPDLAFSAKPKTMELMEGQPYSTAFRKSYPKFNGLIWAYHWLQVGLYEPLVTGKTREAKEAGVVAAVTRFRQMLLDPPRTMPYVMPMTAAIAPEFSRRYPEAAIIFDNLHSMHDVVSDILANPTVARERKRDEILLAARRYRDDTSFVQSEAEWRAMAQMMGVENMGGPVVGFLPALPTPTVERGAVMAGMDHAGHAMPMSPDTSRPAMPHDMPGMDFYMRLLSDPEIRRRLVADSGLRRMMNAAIDQMPAEHRDMMRQMLRDEPAPPAATPVPTSPARTTSRPTAKRASKPAPKSAPKPPAKRPPPAAKRDSMPDMKGMDHGKMPGMKKP